MEISSSSRKKTLFFLHRKTKTFFCGLLSAISFMAPAIGNPLIPLSLQASMPQDFLPDVFSSDNLCARMLRIRKEPLIFAGSSVQMGFVKENGRYELGAGIAKKKNLWGIHYGFHGFSLLSRQGAVFSYTRNLIDGLAAGIHAGYDSDSPIEHSPRRHCIRVGLSASYRIRSLSFYFSYRQRVGLNPGERREWNEAIVLRTGTAWQANRIRFGLDLEKDIRYKLQGFLSLGYLLKERFFFYGQCGVNPVTYRLGFAFLHKSFGIGICSRYQPPLGVEGSIGIVWNRLFKTKAE